MPLTDVKVRNAKPTARPQRLWDSGGLYLEVSPSGGKLWRLKYRVGGKEKLLALGKWNAVSLAEAREKRDAAKKLLAQKTDPAEQRKADKREAAGRAANSFEVVAREWFEKRKGRWTPHHAKDVLRRLERNLFTDLGARPIAEIKTSEVLVVVRKVDERGAHDLARRMLQVASQVFRYGKVTERNEHNPAADLHEALTPSKPRNQPAVKPEELPALLRDIDRYDQIGDLQTKIALKLLALTFVRTGELIGAEWPEFHLDKDEPIWIVPAERMKMRTEHVVPLSRQAVQLLAELRKLSGDSTYVFPGRDSAKPISNNTLLGALYRLGYQGRMTGHGFRAVASTVLNESGRFRPDVIERQLAHCERNDVRGAYNRAEYVDERRKMMQWYANKLDELARGGEVVPFKRAAPPRK
ncbi:MAG TPA: integrase arm-type DNA-binding domain-containing protein [Casimicrobiaceae bacterium]|nr:integrase arm-type DNA-binding domain-containing protein [Casimicrobiaceae bacterium]